MVDLDLFFTGEVGDLAAELEQASGSPYRRSYRLPAVSSTESL
ncbi:MAG: hypothetical protein U0X20_12390 [Caldilineaceae bacterium]